MKDHSKHTSKINTLGYKLEPIVDVKTNSLFAYEMLTVFDENVDSEVYFDNAPTKIVWELIQKQLSLLKTIDNQGIIFINVPCSLMIDCSAVNHIIDNHPPNLGIELQDPKNINLLDENSFNLLINNIREMTSAEVPVWLDDIDLSLYDVAMRLKENVSGLKIDKYEFWKSINYGYFPLLIEKMAQISNSIIVEGIETKYNLKDLNINYGLYAQGYLWPSIFIEKTHY